MSLLTRVGGNGADSAGVGGVVECGQADHGAVPGMAAPRARAGLAARSAAPWAVCRPGLFKRLNGVQGPASAGVLLPDPRQPPITGRGRAPAPAAQSY